MLSRRILFLVPLLFSLQAFVWISPSLAASQEFDHSYPLQPGGSFTLQNVNGSVTVQAWDRNEVEVRAVKSARQEESDLDMVSIDVAATPQNVSVDTRYSQNDGVEVVVDYTILVPRSAKVTHLTTVNGAVRVSNIASLEDVHTVNGNIELYEASGSLHAHTINGNVRLELLDVQNKNGVTAETTNGSIFLLVPATLAANLNIRCLNGAFHSDIPISLESAQNLRQVHGRLGKGGNPITLHTVNGAVGIAALQPTI